MEILSKQQRHEVYKLALERLMVWHRYRFEGAELRDEESPYLCDNLRVAIDRLNYASGLTSLEVVETLHEFMSHKPEYVEMYEGWWDRDDTAKRIEVLNECIKLTEW